jgi:DNA-binding NarL/FixJ family response regulator
MMEVWAALEQRHTSWAEKRILSSWDELGGIQVRAECLAGKANEEGRHILYAETLALVHEKRYDEAISVGSALVELDRTSSPEAFDRGQALILLTQALIAAGDAEAARLNLDLLNDLLAHSCPYPYLSAHATELEGSIRMMSGEFAGASEMFNEAARTLEDCSNHSDRARCTREAAEALAANESPRGEIVGLLRSARALAEESGATAEQDRIDALLRSVGVRPRSGRPRRKESGSVLSAREAEVAVLVAAGETNAGIARELFLSDRTVQDHITNALKKLGLSGRAGLAAWAAREGLV